MTKQPPMMSDSNEGNTVMLCTMLNSEITETKAMGEWQLETILGSEMLCSYAVVEIPVKTFMTMDGGPEAVDKELGEMERRRFNKSKPVPEHLKRQHCNASSSVHRNEMAG